MVHDPERKGRGLAGLACLVLLASPAAALAASYTYVAEGHPLHYLRGLAEPDPGWTAPGFVPGPAWTYSEAGFGIGYGDGDDRTVLADMAGSYLTVYAVARFTVGPERSALTGLELSAVFDDGFVAYLNGVEVARSHMPAGPPFHDLAASSHEASSGPEVFAIDPALLAVGDNVFAVEVHNASLGSSDLSFIPTLVGRDDAPSIRIGPIVQQVGRRRALVAWETDGAAPGRVAYGPGPELGRVAESAGVGTRHEVWLEGLVPSSSVHYSVGSPGDPSASGVFHTERDRAAPYRVVVFGDTRSNHDAHRTVVAGIEREAADLLLHTGDLVADGTVEAQWEVFFDIEAALLRAAPIYPSVGNHERDAVLYLEHFALPEGSPGGELYYTFRYSTSAFVVVDLYQSTYTTGSTQHGWLVETLEAHAADPSVRHVFVHLHHGPYDSGSHGSNLRVREHLVPLFEANGVEMVFSGHDHTYERSTVNGVVYVVTGGGGAPLYSASGDWWTEVAENTYHYCVLDIDGPVVRFVARRPDGSLVDELTVGTDPGECASAAECEAGAHEPCEADEAGAWSCVGGACIWSCAYLEPEPDGDADADLDGDVDGDVDGDTDGDADADADADGDAEAEAPGGSVGGCACRAGGGPKGPGAALALLAALVVVRRAGGRRPRGRARRG